MGSINKLMRLATEKDSETLLSIYGEYVKNTTVSFETEVPSVLEFGKRITDVLAMFPWLVCEMNGDVVGYAYASKHRVRTAYQWSVDVSVYINPNYHGKHIATALYHALFELLKIQGYYNAFAGVAAPNINSARFHESFGFQPIGVYHNVGYKLGQWLDVQWFEYTINEHSNNPSNPKTINEIVETNQFNECIIKAIQMIKG